MKYILLTAILIATSAAVMAKNDKEKPEKYKDATVYAVPDIGSTAVMLGMALGGLTLFRRMTWH